MKRRRLIFATFGFILAIAVVLSMSSCNISGHGTLTIRNNSSFDVDFVTWTSDNGITYSFGDDSVWDYSNSQYEWGIAASGGWDSRQVDFGSDNIYFCFTNDINVYRTTAVVEVGLFTDGHFTFYDGFAFFSLTDPDGSTRTSRYDFIPVPGMTKPAK
jgi:hypothetical protein